MRYRLRSLTILVGIIALVMGFIVLRHRARHYKAKALEASLAQESFLLQARSVLENLDPTTREAQHLRRSAALASSERAYLEVEAKRWEERAIQLRREAAWCQRVADYYVSLKRKYLRAASHPWES